jgi:hypothetical protein
MDNRVKTNATAPDDSYKRLSDSHALQKEQRSGYPTPNTTHSTAQSSGFDYQQGPKPLRHYLAQHRFCDVPALRPKNAGELADH